MSKIILNPEWVNARYEEMIVNSRELKLKEPIGSKALQKKYQARLKANAFVESIMKDRGLEQLVTGPRRWNSLEDYSEGKPPIPQWIPL